MSESPSSVGLPRASGSPLAELRGFRMRPFDIARDCAGVAPLPSGAYAPEARGALRMLDVTVVLLHDGMASTAIMPVEIFHAAGALWNQLHDRPPERAF